MGTKFFEARSPRSVTPRAMVWLCALGALAAVACGGKLASGEAAPDGAGTSPAPRCGVEPCEPDASSPAPPDASMSPPLVDASIPADVSDGSDGPIEDTSSPGADAGEESSILAPCVGVGNVLHFEVLGTEGPLPVESKTYTSAIGFGGPGGPIGQANSLFVRVMANDPDGTDSFYLSMPYGTPLGTLSCADPGPVRVEVVINDYTCVPDSGTVEILDLQVPDAGEQLGSLLVWFDLLSSECTESGQVASQQEVRGCASYGE
jgi:hypothetical protein